MKLSRYTEFIKESNEDIDSICERYGIKNYTINSDGSIDVDGHVNLNERGLTNIPLKFNRVSKWFDCADNKLASLEGCPKYVGDGFYCENNQLVSLKGCPKWVGDEFYCSYNQLSSLEGGPNFVRGNFGCLHNGLTSLEGFPEDYEGEVYIGENPVYEILSLFLLKDQIKSIYWINEFDVIRDGNKVVLDRLEEVFIQMGLKVPQNLKFKNYEVI